MLSSVLDEEIIGSQALSIVMPRLADYEHPHAPVKPDWALAASQVSSQASQQVEALGLLPLKAHA